MVSNISEKRIYNGLPDLLSRIAYEELEQLGDEITECQVVYLPQVFVLLESHSKSCSSKLWYCIKYKSTGLFWCLL